MQLIEKLYNPFVRKDDSTKQVMVDVIIALLPCIVVTWFAYGFTPIMVVLISVGSALLGEFIFNVLLSGDTRSLGDGSSIITGILLAFTIGTFTPLPIVAFGSAMAVIFGKMLWGGVGRNKFNPALVGREFMVVFFPAIMNSSSIFRNEVAANYSGISLFEGELWNNLIFKPSGAIGEYSPILLIIGGLFLLLRRRISWHTPFAMLGVFTILIFIFRSQNVSFALGALLLGSIYMATDMPTSPSTPAGKFYFGVVIGVVAFICLLFGATRGYFSYSILIANAFMAPINWVFQSRVWGRKARNKFRIWELILLTIAILAITSVVMWLHHIDALLYPILIYMVYSIARFVLSDKNRPWGRILDRSITPSKNKKGN